MEEYITWKRSHLQPTSVVSYVLWVNRFNRFIKKDPLEVVIQDIGEFKNYLIESGFAPKNIQYGLSILRDYLGYLISVKKIEFPLKMFKIKMERSNSHHPITREEYDRLLTVFPKNHARTIQSRLMVMMLWDTGMRVGEMTALKISQLQERTTIIENEKNKRSRMISWSQETEDLLQFYLPMRKQMKCKDDWLFISLQIKTNRALTTRQVQRIIENATKKAGIKSEIRPHSFRHGFVHRRLDEGKPVTTVAQMLGHSTTMNVLTYAQLSSREIKDAWGMGTSPKIK